PKILKSCKNKWASLKAIFKMIESYQNVSGAHWDLQRGANIQGEAAMAIFSAFIAQKVCLDIFINMV
ncbi:hypothetical protein L208DRAFT_1286882, partial [Tricholoma matsutake]